jgi:hypothetical protein
MSGELFRFLDNDSSIQTERKIPPSTNEIVLPASGLTCDFAGFPLASNRPGVSEQLLSCGFESFLYNVEQRLRFFG